MFDLLLRFGLGWKPARFAVTEVIVAEKGPFVRNKFVTPVRQPSEDGKNRLKIPGRHGPRNTVPDSAKRSVGL